MGFIVPDDELPEEDGLRLRIELRRESLYVGVSTGTDSGEQDDAYRMLFAYGHDMSPNGGEATTLEMDYRALALFLRWLLSERGRERLIQHGMSPNLWSDPALWSGGDR